MEKDLEIKSEDIIDMTEELVSLREMQSFFKMSLQRLELEEKVQKELESEMKDDYPFLFLNIQESSVKPEVVVHYEPEVRQMSYSNFYSFMCKFSLFAYIYSFFCNDIVIIDNQNHGQKR